MSGACLRVINRAAAALAMNPAIRAKSLGNVSFTYADVVPYLTLTEDDRRVLSRYKVWM